MQGARGSEEMRSAHVRVFFLSVFSRVSVYAHMCVYRYVFVYFHTCVFVCVNFPIYFNESTILRTATKHGITEQSEAECIYSL